MERLFEEVFVEVCAPTLRGIKPSNLFRYQPQNRDKLLEAPVFIFPLTDYPPFSYKILFTFSNNSSSQNFRFTLFRLIPLSLNL